MCVCINYPPELVPLLSVAISNTDYRLKPLSSA